MKPAESGLLFISSLLSLLFSVRSVSAHRDTRPTANLGQGLLFALFRVLTSCVLVLSRYVTLEAKKIHDSDFL